MDGPARTAPRPGRRSRTPPAAPPRCSSSTGPRTRGSGQPGRGLPPRPRAARSGRAGAAVARPLPARAARGPRATPPGRPAGAGARVVRPVPALSGDGGGGPDAAGAVGTVLVEGESDARAVEALARRAGLDGASYVVVAMGGVTNVGRHLRELVGQRPDPLVAGLCDAGEVDVVARALTRTASAGAGPVGPRRARVLRLRGRPRGRAAAGARRPGRARGRRGAGRPALLPRDGRAGAAPGPSAAAAAATLPRQRVGPQDRYAPLLVEALPEGAEPAPLAALVAHVARWSA